MKKCFPTSRIFEVGKVGMESSNQIAPLFRQLTAKGYNVVVSHPKKTRYIAEAKIKCDRVDSKIIAELVRLDALPLAYFPERKNRLTSERRLGVGLSWIRERVKLRVRSKAS